MKRRYRNLFGNYFTHKLIRMNFELVFCIFRDNDPKNSEELEDYLRFLLQFSLDDLTETPFPRPISSSLLNPETYLNIIHNLTRNRKFTLTIESAVKLSFNLDPVLTEIGPCFTFNSVILNSISWNYILTGKLQPLQPVYKTFFAQGDVTAILSGQEDDEQLVIYFHSPLGFPVKPYEHVLITNDSSISTSMELSTFDIVSHVKVKRLYKSQRKCLFFYEGTLTHSPFIYSEELCKRECRINKLKELCHCLPHLYRLHDQQETYCDHQGLQCVKENIGKSYQSVLKF